MSNVNDVGCICQSCYPTNCCVPENQRLSDDEAFATRYANFYNNYNIDWRTQKRPRSEDQNKGNCKCKCMKVCLKPQQSQCPACPIYCMLV
nr:unnamed protein product [Callosobruchus analis]